ncbi:ATP synthase subunit I [Litoribacillus peritrichatus]|uniref:F0F1 ATP synthase subunit I n=1 Tax=Litoribacillus peritrichatus TaxID=718191 RepID=A0ABP7NCI5_9GAMM
MQSTIPTPPVFRIIIVQSIITCVIASVFFFAAGEVAAISSFFGGMIYTVPNAYFVKKAWQHVGASQAAHAVQSFYKGVTWKMLLSAALFGLLFKSYPQADLIAVFTTFMAAMMCNILAPLYIKF